MGIHKVRRRAVFLDRDGVLNRNVYNPESTCFESPLSPADAVLHENVLPALLSLREAGYLLILVSNQPNYAKGKSTLAALEQIHQRIFAPIEAAGIAFAAIHYCFHHPEGIVAGYSTSCPCRKPSPKFILDDQVRFGLTLSDCWMVGDREADIQCGFSAGVRTILLEPDHPSAADVINTVPDFHARNLPDAAALILRTETTAQEELDSRG